MDTKTGWKSISAMKLTSKAAVNAMMRTHETLFKTTAQGLETAVEAKCQTDAELSRG